MTVKVLTNSSPSAPTLNGAAGSLIAVLDYCLTNATYGVGWVKEYAGTNLASYRAPAGNRMYLGVDDSGTLQTRVRGFETMTAAGVAVASGTGAFPTDAQQSGGCYLYKSSDTGTARNWLFAGDGKCFYFSSRYNGADTGQAIYFFGEFPSYKAGDNYNTLLMADASAGGVSGGNVAAGYSSGQPGHYLPRAHGQMGGAIMCGKGAADSSRYSASNTYLGFTGLTYPSPLDGGLVMCPVLVTEISAGVRGVLPGLWNPCHAKPLAEADTFSGSGTLAGRNFLVRNLGSSAQCFLETSDTWYA